MHRDWRIKIIQHECFSPMIAPDGCLQYHTKVSGKVTSFNFKMEDNSEDKKFPNQISKLNYNVCLRRER